MNNKKLFRFVLRLMGVIVTSIILLDVYSHNIVSPLAGLTLWFAIGTFCVLPFTLLIISAFVPRVFCRFLCPMGAAFDVVGWLAKKLGVPRISARWVPNLRFVFLVAVIAAAFFGIAGALILDPTVLFKGFILLSPYSWGLILVPILLFLTLFIPNFWCVRGCPLGALQDVVFFPFRIVKKLLNRQDEKPSEDLHSIAQRRYAWAATILGLTAAGAYGAYTKQEESKKSSQRNPLILPPGAGTELQMASQCARCGACFKSCPTKAIQPIPFEQSPALWGAPNVDFQSESDHPSYCEYTCNTCSEVCPTGAIAKLTLEEKQKIVLRPVTLNYSECRLNFEKECSICVNVCPTSAIEKQWSDEQYLTILTVNMDLCVGCGKCAANCPEKALTCD